MERKEVSKFSIVFDEWTSNGNRRYINIILLLYNKHWNLGLVRILGSATAANCLELVEEHLKVFGLDLKKDVICIVTDGCNVMKCIGGMIKPVKQQLCFAHAIQLAVVDVLYKRPNTQPAFDENQNSTENDFEFQHENIEGDGIFFEEEEGAEVNSSYFQLVQKVRSVVCLFRNSPLKNELQKYAKNEFSKELKLTLDCKTRWNSLCGMLVRFIEMKGCILKAMIDLNIRLKLEDSDIRMIEEMANALKPLQTTVETLCRRDMSLFKTDAALTVLLDHLAEQETSISNLLYFGLIDELKKKHTFLSDALGYLQTCKTKFTIYDHLNVKAPSQHQISKLISSIKPTQTQLTTIQKDELCDSVEESDSSDIEKSEPPKKKTAFSFQDKVNQALEHVNQTIP